MDNYFIIKMKATTFRIFIFIIIYFKMNSTKIKKFNLICLIKL